MAEKISDTDIEYVYVETVYNSKSNFDKDRYEIFSGLLQGIKVENGSTFILLHGSSLKKKMATILTNSKFYDIMTIEVLHKNHKDLVYLTTKKHDQNLALEMLTVLHNTLLKNGMELNEEGLIDISKYSNVPEEYFTGTKKKLDDSATHKVVNGFINNDSYNRSPYINTNTHVPDKKEEIVPSVFGRTKSKKPSKDHLVLMQEKINQINNGEFICNLPDVVEDQVEDDGKKNLYEEDNMRWA